MKIKNADSPAMTRLKFRSDRLVEYLFEMLFHVLVALTRVRPNLSEILDVDVASAVGNEAILM